MTEVLLIIIGIVFITGFVVLFFKLGKTGSKGVTEEVAQLLKQIELLNNDKSTKEERARMLQNQLDHASMQIKDKDTAILELNNKLSTSIAEYSNLQKKLDEQKADIERLQDKFRIEFKNLANEILEEKTQKFTEQNKIKLDEILKPLSEKIRDFEKKVEETYDKEGQPSAVGVG